MSGPLQPLTYQEEPNGCGIDGGGSIEQKKRVGAPMACNKCCSPNLKLYKSATPVWLPVYNFMLRLQHLLQAIGALTRLVLPNSATPIYANPIWFPPNAFGRSPADLRRPRAVGGTRQLFVVVFAY